MANTTIQLKKSSTPSAQPADLANGEIAINYADGKLFYKDSTGIIQQISGGGNNFSTINAAGTLIIADVSGDILTIDAGQNIEILSSPLLDSLTISANLTSANNWANTKLSNGTVTLAGALTTTGQIFANNQLTIYPLGGLEGGQIDILGSESYPDWSIDSYGNALRFFTLNSGIQQVTFFNAGGGSVRMGVGTGNPQYAVDVNGDVNVTGKFRINGTELATGTTDLSPANNYAGAMANSVNSYTSATYSTLTQFGSVFGVANGAFDKANAANVLAYNTGIGANVYTDSATVSANNYAGAMANSANAYAASLTPDLSPVFVVANNAFDKANAANVLAYNTGIGANNYAGTMANSVNAYTSAIYATQTSLSTGLSSANNYAGVMANSANAYSDSLLITGRAYTNTSTDAANNYAGVMANSVNAYTSTTYATITTVATNATSANNYAGAMANSTNAYADSLLVTSRAYTNTSTDSSNNYAGVMANSSNGYTVSVGASGNAYVNVVGASANSWANTKLSNTDGVLFNGSLNVKNTLYAYDVVIANSMIANITGNVADLTVRNNVFIGGSITNVTQLIFNTSTNITPTTPGAITWSQDDSTLHFDMDSPNNVVGHIGQDLFYYVKNQTGSTIPKGTVVRFAGTLGASGRLLIAPAIANNSYPSKYIMGVTAASIATGADGFVISQGKIRGIDTSMFSDGDILYVSPSTAGGFSNTMPVAPNNKVTVAAVIKSDNIQGSIQVRVTLGSKINEDELAEINGLTNGDVLAYVSANGRFENKNTLVSAYNTTNAAFDVVNSAYTSSNTGYTVANAAFNSANASNTWANNTFVKLVAGQQTITGDLAITGNLTFLGNSTVISTTNLEVGDSLIYLAANNYSGTDLVDIGFVGNYGNTTGANVHTGLYRDATSKQYYLFSGYDIEPGNTSIVPYSNNMVNAVLNADLKTSNLSLGGANAIVWIKSSYDNSNGAFGVTNASFNLTNATYTAVNSAFAVINASFGSANTVGGYVNTVGSYANTAGSLANQAGVIANAAFDHSNTTYGAVNSAFAVINAAYTQSNTNSTNITNLATAANNYAGAMANSANAYATATYATQTTVATNATSANNYAGAMANASNAYAATVGTSTNNYTSATYATITTVATNAISANNYAGAMANSVNAYTSTTYATSTTVSTGLTSANNYAGAMANAANAYAASLTPDLSPAFNKANASYTVANAAFDKANSANLLAYNTGIGANNYSGAMANSVNSYTSATYSTLTQFSSSFGVANAGFDKANSANVLAKAAFDYANTLGGGGATISATAPSSPTAGALWWNDVYGRLLIYYNDGNTSQWVDALTNPTAAKVYMDSSAPSGVQAGSLWWNSYYGRLFVYYDDGDTQQWVDANPAQNLSAFNDLANAAFNTANAAATYAYVNTSVGVANSWANTIGASSNAYINVSTGAANAYVNVSTGAANTWANSVGVNANTYANTNFATITNATAAFAKANAAASTGKAIAMAIVFGG